jgi:hypothetical protein
MVNILNPITRIFISLCVVGLLSILVFPHFMDVDPPTSFRILLKPAEFAGGAIAPLIGHPNIGTAEHPIYEGTPIDLMVGFILILGTIILYGVVTYLLLTTFVCVVRRFRDVESQK